MVNHVFYLCVFRQEELRYQSEVRDEMSQLENSLALVKRDYELLKIDYDQNIASNEQAAPRAKYEFVVHVYNVHVCVSVHRIDLHVYSCHRELQLTVSSLQKNIHLLKGEISRYKTRAHKAEEKVNKLMVNAMYCTSCTCTMNKHIYVHVLDDHWLLQRVIPSCRYSNYIIILLLQEEKDKKDESKQHIPATHVSANNTKINKSSKDKKNDNNTSSTSSTSRPRSLSASNIEQVAMSTDSLQLQEEVICLKDELVKLVTEKKALDNRIAELMAVSKETKDKAELISTEKKARQYVINELHIII